MNHIFLGTIWYFLFKFTTIRFLFAVTKTNARFDEKEVLITILFICVPRIFLIYFYRTSEDKIYMVCVYEHDSLNICFLLGISFPEIRHYIWCARKLTVYRLNYKLFEFRIFKVKNFIKKTFFHDPIHTMRQRA